MHKIATYFNGEKVQCIIGIVISLACIAASVYFLTTQKPQLKGIAYSFLPLSVFLLMICVSVVSRTAKDIDRVSNFLTEEPVKLKSEELPRMKKVMRNFGIIKKVELALFVIGLMLALAFWRTDLVRGIAIGLVIQGIVLYLFDHYAEARGDNYIQFLESF